MRQSTGTRRPANLARLVATLLAVLGTGTAVRAAEPGALGPTSQVSIRITVSVAPRISYRSVIQIEPSAALPRSVMLRCAHLNSGTGAFSLVAVSEVADGAEVVSGDVGDTVLAARTTTLPLIRARAVDPSGCGRGRDSAWKLPEDPALIASSRAQVLLLVAQ